MHTDHPCFAVPPTLVLQSQLKPDAIIPCGPPPEPQAPVGGPALGKAGGGGHSRSEYYITINHLSLGTDPLDTDLERFGVLSPVVPAMNDFRERSEVIRRFTEVRISLKECDFTDCAHGSEERGLAGAVLADEESERRQWHGVLPAEAAEVAQPDFLQLTVAHDRPLTPCPAKGIPA